MSVKPAPPAKPLPEAEIRRQEAIAASSDEAMLAKLPAPPQPFSEMDEVDIEMWLRRVAEAGGAEGLQWCYDPRNWPYGATMRSRVQHIVGGLMRKLDEDNKRKREQEAAEQAAKARDAHRELLKSKGWRVT